MPDFIRRVPEGDNRERLICPDCGHIAYENPKVVVGSVVAAGDRALLCRRAIPPREGYWTIPAGFLELGETAEEGAVREAREEAEADIRLDGILGVFTISRIGQLQVIFRAGFAGQPHYAPGTESLDVQLFAWDDIPWDEIAFPSVHWALDAWRTRRDGALGAPARNPLSDPRGAAPMDWVPKEFSA